MDAFLNVLNKLSVKNVTLQVSPFISKAKKTLSKNDFQILLYQVCCDMWRRKLREVSVSLFVQYCAFDEVSHQDSYFQYCISPMLLRTYSLEQIKELFQILQPFLDKFDFLNPNKKHEIDISQFLSFYHLILGNTDLALVSIKNTAGSVSHVITLLNWFYKMKQYQTVVLLWESTTTTINIQDPFFYLVSLCNLQQYHKVIEYYHAHQKVTLTAKCKYFVLQAASYMNDMRLFEQLFEQITQESYDTEKVLPSIKYIIFNLNKFRHYDWIVRLNEEVLSRFKDTGGLLEQNINIIKHAQEMLAKKNAT